MQIFIMDIDVFSDQKIFEKVQNLLMEDRVIKIRSMKQEKSKKLSAAAGFLLFYGLMEQGIDPGKCHIELGEHGKPFIKETDSLYFNLSHSGSKAVCVFDTLECGVDIEQIRDNNLSDSLFRKVCSEKEYLGLQTLDTPHKKDQFYKIWTIKESIMKCTGQGLSLSPSDIITYETENPEICVWNQYFIHTVPLEDYYLSVCSENINKKELLYVDKAVLSDIL